ncbi:MAG: radical SAM protein, partial [Ruminococcaceae bacterium]|nr:radical SAM protein [Oscillospiraceae bacterium]
MRQMDKAFLEISNICNLQCSFCHGTKREKRSLTKEEFELLTDRLSGQVKYLYFHLMGEPLLHPLLPCFIERAWAKGFRPMITTNGTLLGQKGEEVLKKPPYKISISLHAPAANAVFAAKHYLDDCIAFARAAAAKGCIVALRLWNLESADEQSNASVLKQLHTAFPGEWGQIRGGSSLRLAPRLFLEWGKRFDWPDLNAPEHPADTDVFCYGLRDQIGILSDGTVVPCCLDADGHLALGNLFSTALQDIL